jgi:excisionase family DNA binding protein
MTTAMTTAAAPAVPEKLLYKIPDAMRLLSLSRSVIYEQIRVGRLRVVKQGRATLVPASAITDYIALLEREAQELV